MLNKKSGIRRYFLFMLCGFLFLPFSSQGCAMSDTEAVEIHRILLKPADNTKTNTNAQGELSVAYLDYLRNALKPEPLPDGQTAAGDEVVKLNYVRPMSGGVHVIQIEPAMQREAAITLTEALTALDDVEYAEPDFPRRRR